MNNALRLKLCWLALIVATESTMAQTGNSEATFGGYPIQEYSGDVLLSNFSIDGICFDNRGFLYASDEFGLLEFNSSRWRRVFDGDVLDLATGPHGCIFGLRRDEVCRWVPSKTGDLQYESFRTRMENLEAISDLEFTAAAFRDLARVGEDLYATKTFAVVRFSPLEDGSVELTAWNRRKVLTDPPRKFRRVREVNGRPLFQLEEYRDADGASFAWLNDDDELEVIPPLKTQDGRPVKGHVTDFVAVGDGTDRFIAAATSAGVYLCDNGVCTWYDFSGVFQGRANFISVERVGPGRFAVATLDSGVLLFDVDGKVDTLLPPFRQAQQIIKLLADQLGRLWLPGLGSLVRIDHGSGIRRWETPDRLTAMSTVEFDGHLVVATTKGIYAAATSDVTGLPVEPFSLVPQFGDDRAWHLDVIDGHLFVSQLNGLSICRSLKEDATSRLVHRAASYFGVVPFGDQLLAHTRTGSAFTFPDAESVWSASESSPIQPQQKIILPSRIRQPILDLDSAFWVSGRRDYVEPIVVRLDQTGDRKEYRGVMGVPFLRQGVVHLASGLNSSVEILKFDARKDRFVREEVLSQVIDDYPWLRKPRNVRSVHVTPEGDVLIATDTVSVFRISTTGPKPTLDLPFGDHDAGTAYEVRVSPKGTIWLATEDFIYARPSTTTNIDQQTDLEVVFSSIQVGGNTSMLPGTETARELELDFDSRALDFEYSVPIVRVPENVRYQTKLHPVEKEWGDWEERSSASYSGLREGQYRFEVRARTFTNMPSSISSIDFTIRPPWYRSPLFYTAAVLLGVSVIGWLFALRRRIDRAHVGELEKEIVERQRAEEEVRRSQKALLKRERIQAVGEMAAGVAHDVNNALTPILVFSELLSDREDFPEQCQQWIASIHKGTQEACDIIQRIQPLYRGADVAREPCDLSSILKDVVASRKAYVDSRRRSQKSIEFHTDLKAVSLYCVESEIRELLNNIVQNATDAIEKTGNLRASCQRVDDSALISISDDGCGMSPEDLENCGELFFTTKGGRGSGIGLSAAHAIVRLYDGVLNIESEQGKGTTVSILLPIVNPETSVTVRSTDAELEPLRVLVVDDVELTREAIVVLFETYGNTVASVSSADDALELLESEPFDLVATDYLMPGMNGYELCREIRRRDLATQIMIASGHEEPGMAEVCDYFLPKPVSSASLRTALLKLQEHKEERGES